MQAREVGDSVSWGCGCRPLSRALVFSLYRPGVPLRSPPSFRLSAAPQARMQGVEPTPLFYPTRARLGSNPTVGGLEALLGSRGCAKDVLIFRAIKIINDAVADQIVRFLVDGIALAKWILDLSSTMVGIKFAEQTNAI